MNEQCPNCGLIGTWYNDFDGACVQCGESPTNPADSTALQDLIDGTFLSTPDEEFRAFVAQMPEKHWAKYDLSAVRLGWEAHKRLNQ